ncbi:hypothetical protein [Shewanella xiamenensis]|nr:hypothetical protein [Shewanella xiamenensis]
MEKPDNALAFTYTIWFPLMGMRYIGYKTINKKDSWLSYKSSSKPVNKLINEGHAAVYRIVKWFDNADDARVEEVSAMTSYNVTKRSEFLNQCIACVKFSGPKSDEARAKISSIHKGVRYEHKLIGSWITPIGTFSTTYDAAVFYKCSASTISRRCKSTKPKFKDWYFQPNDK